MNIGFRPLDVLVQLVSEHVGQVDGGVSSTGTGVVREQHEGCHPQPHWCLSAPEEVPVTNEDQGVLWLALCPSLDSCFK